MEVQIRFALEKELNRLMEQPLVWMNGSFLDYKSAKVSVEDRGFQFSDGVYEVVRAFNGRFFAFDQHLERLHRSLRSVEIQIPWSDQELKSAGEKLLADCHEADATLYLQITRGTAPRSHTFSTIITPTIVMMVRGLTTLAPEVYSTGVGVITLNDERWLRCDIKSIGLLANVLARDRARRANVTECIFVRDGLITEGSSSNVFMVRNGELATPLSDHRILRGVTRDCVLSLARERKLNVAERNISFLEIKEASEVFLTSTTLEVLPVIKIDHSSVGSETVGDVTKSLMEDYRRLSRGGK